MKKENNSYSTSDYQELRSDILARINPHISFIKKFYEELINIKFKDTDLSILLDDNKFLSKRKIDNLAYCNSEIFESVNTNKLLHDITNNDYLYLINSLLRTSSNLSHQLRILKFYSDNFKNDDIGAHLYDHETGGLYWVKIKQNIIRFRDVSSNKNVTKESLKKIFKKIKNSKFTLIKIEYMEKSKSDIKEFLNREGVFNNSVFYKSYNFQ